MALGRILRALGEKRDRPVPNPGSCFDPGRDLVTCGRSCVISKVDKAKAVATVVSDR